MFSRLQLSLYYYRAISIACRNPVSSYAIAYAVVLLSCIRIWSADPTLLYVGRDADFSVWLANTYEHWSAPFAVTALNPFQGMGSTLMPMNPDFNPGAWVFQTNLGLATKFVLSMIVYFLEITASSLLLGRVLGFSWTFSFVAALWLVILYLPPFNFVFGLQGVVATSAQWAHALAVCNLVLILFVLLGKRVWFERGAISAILINCGIATGVLVLLLLCLLAAPFYNAAILPGLMLLCGVIVLSSPHLSQALWRVGAGLYALAVFYVLGIFEFFLAAKSFTARFAKTGVAESSFPQFHWPIELSQTALDSAQKWLCAGAVICGGKLPFPGALTGAYWLHIAIIAGGMAVWLREPVPLARIGGGFALVWFGLLLFWLCCSLGIITDVAISPIYIIVPLHPFWAFFSLYSMWLIVRFVVAKITILAPRQLVKHSDWVRLFVLPLAIAVGSLTIAGVYGRDLSRGAPFVNYFTQRGAFESRKTGPIVDRVRREIALRPGETFRGSVATILGSKGGLLRKVLGLPETAPLVPGQHETFLNHELMATGNDHTLLDMWWHDIPTLSEYAQGISRQFVFYMTNFLSDPGDPNEVSVVFARRANVEVLRAMGVRFIIIDRELSNEGVTFLIEESFRGAGLYLYEIVQPNLGDYTPIVADVVDNLGVLRTKIDGNPSVLASRALVHSPLEGHFVPARDARMFFEKNAVRVTASSSGRSMLLLPVQFSHCLRISDPRVQVVRSGLIFTLIIFEGALDARLNWEFNFWGHSGCRMKDVADLRELGLIQ